MLDCRLFLRVLDRHAADDAPAGDQGFVSVAPPAATHDFSFLAPCPASGLIIHGEEDTAVPPDAVHKLVERLSIQKGVEVAVDVVPGANHFFTDHLDPLIARVSDYLDASLAKDPEPAPLF